MVLLARDCLLPRLLHFRAVSELGELGSEVNAGDLLVILESMKMEIPVVAPVSGTVTEIYVTEQGIVKGGHAIAVIVEHSEQAPN